MFFFSRRLQALLAKGCQAADSYNGSSIMVAY